MKNTVFNLRSLKYLLVVVCSFAFVATSATPALAWETPWPDPSTPPPTSEPSSGGGTPAVSANTDEVKAGLSEVGGNEAGNGGNALTGIIKNLIDILLFLVGTISVIMIIVGGIRYTTSNGDQAQITSAKNTVLYSIVGVVVALMAYALVSFIVDKI